MTLSPELLNAIEAGCDGVSPGPWQLEAGAKPPFAVVRPAGEAELGTYSVAREVWWHANAAHIARLDPATARELVAGYRAWLASEERNKLYRQALSSADAFTATLNPNLLPEGAAQQWEATREALRRAEVPHV
jgi:hypothetical protein